MERIEPSKGGRKTHIMDWEEACRQLEALKAILCLEWYILERRCVNLGNTSADQSCYWRISVYRGGKWFITEHKTLDLAILWAREFTCQTPAVTPESAADAERAVGAQEIAPGIFGRDQELQMDPDAAAGHVPDDPDDDADQT